MLSIVGRLLHNLHDFLDFDNLNGICFSLEQLLDEVFIYIVRLVFQVVQTAAEVAQYGGVLTEGFKFVHCLADAVGFFLDEKAQVATALADGVRIVDKDTLLATVDTVNHVIHVGSQCFDVFAVQRSDERRGLIK